MPASRHQAAADEYGRRDLIELRQLADGVEDHRVDARLGVDRQIAAPFRGQALALAQPLDVAESLRMPRGKNQQRVGPGLRRPHAIECADDRLFLALRGAARRRTPAVPATCGRIAARARVRARCGGRIERVELEAAGHGDAARVGAELAEAARRLFTLHAEAIDVAEHPPHERTDDAVARKRSRRDAAVDERGAHVAAPALAQQVRPDLGLDHHEEPRLHEIQRPPHGECPVEREIEHGVGVGDAARQLLTRQRRRREKHAQRGIPRLAVRRDRPRGEHLADRHRVDPDRFFGVEVERNRQVAEPLARGCRRICCGAAPDTGSTAPARRARSESRRCRGDTR